MKPKKPIASTRKKPAVIPKNELEMGAYLLALDKEYQRLPPKWFDQLSTDEAREIWITRLEELGAMEPRVRRSKQALQDASNPDLRSTFGYAIQLFEIPICKIHIMQTCFGSIFQGKVDASWFELPHFVARKLDITVNGVFTRKVQVEPRKFMKDHKPLSVHYSYLYSIAELNNVTRYSLWYIARFIRTGFQEGLFNRYVEKESTLDIMQPDIPAMTEKERRILHQRFNPPKRKRGRPLEFGNNPVIRENHSNYQQTGKYKGKAYRYQHQGFESMEPD